MTKLKPVQLKPTLNDPFATRILLQQEFVAGRSTNSIINSHIVQMAKKPDGKRGLHPKIGTRAFEDLKKLRGFREVA
jgi:hypothetical protein